MLKKILFSTSIALIITAAIITFYIFSIKYERPNTDVVLNSTLHEQHFQAAEQRARTWLQELYHDYPLPSFSAAIGIDNQLIWAGTIGYADLKNVVAANQDTQYRVGSIAKSMTAAATLKLQEQGKLNIEDRFSSLVQGFSPSEPTYTLKHLLSHQSGIRHYTSNIKENFLDTEFPSTREAAALIENDPLLFQPGEGFHYSTYGYTVLALALESAENKNFEAIMKDEVFQPLMLSNTGFDHAAQAPDNKAQSYLEISGSLYQAPATNLSYKYAGGGYLSTPSDLVKFGGALLEGSYLSASSLDLLWQPQALNNGNMNIQNYALGFRVDDGEFGKVIHHGGKSVGGYAFLILFPESQTVVAFASNVTPSNNIFSREDEARKLADIFFQQKQP